MASFQPPSTTSSRRQENVNSIRGSQHSHRTQSTVKRSAAENIDTTTGKRAPANSENTPTAVRSSQGANDGKQQVHKAYGLYKKQTTRSPLPATAPPEQCRQIGCYNPSRPDGQGYCDVHSLVNMTQ